MKKIISGIIIGAVLGTAIGGFAVSSIVDNRFPIMVNGEKKNIQGYNIDDRTYFKLRDIADATGGFTVDFKDDTILINTNASSAPQPDQSAAATQAPATQETSAPASDHEALDKFLSDEFENLTVMTQADQFKSVTDDNTSVPCRNKHISHYYADFDGDGSDELVIYSEAAAQDNSDMLSNKCISVWTADKQGAVTKKLAKIGLASRTSYRYSVVINKGRAYLAEIMADASGDYKEGDIKILSLDGSDFKSVHRMRYAEHETESDYSIDGDDVSRDDFYKERDALQAAIVYAPFNEE